MEQPKVQPRTDADHGAPLVIPKGDICRHEGATETSTERLPRYELKDMDIPVTLIGVVQSVRCKDCDATIAYHIPDERKLYSAAIVARLGHSLKLRGREIKFIRKVLDLPAKEFAAILDVAPETLSRWEGDKQPMPPATERILRLTVGGHLAKYAPLIPFDTTALVQMEFQAVQQPGQELNLSFVRIKQESRTEEGNLKTAYAEAV